MKKYLVIAFVISFFSCSKKQNTSFAIEQNKIEKFPYVKNNNLKDVLSHVIKENEEIKAIKILLLDDDEKVIMLVEIDDMVENCEKVKAIYQFKDINIIAEDLSVNGSFDKLLNLDIDNRLELCKQFEIDFVGISDPITYPFQVMESGEIFYPNGDSLIYTSKGIKLNFWKN